MSSNELQNELRSSTIKLKIVIVGLSVTNELQNELSSSTIKLHWQTNYVTQHFGEVELRWNYDEN